MNRTPCIAFRANSPNIVIRRDFLDICDGKHAVALVLSQMMYWHEVKVAHRFQAATTNKQSTAVGKAATQYTDVWVWKKQAELQAELLNAHGLRAIGDALVYLVGRGFLSERNNPYNQYDRTMQYRFEAGTVQAAIDALPSLAEETDIIEDGDAPPVAPRLRSNKTAKTQTHLHPFIDVVNETAIPQSRKTTQNRGDETAGMQLCERSSAASTLQDCGLLSKNTSEVTYSKNTTTDYVPSANSGGAPSPENGVVACSIYGNDCVTPSTVTPSINMTFAGNCIVTESDVDARLKEIKGVSLDEGLSSFASSSPVKAREVHPLVARLIAIGVTAQTAEDLVTDYSARIPAQLAYLPYRPARDKAALIVAAIEGNYAPPAGWVDAQAADERPERDRERAERASAERTKREEETQREERRWEDKEERLSESDRASLDRAVWGELARGTSPAAERARGVRDGRTTTEDALASRLVSAEYHRVRREMLGEKMVKGGDTHG